MRYLYVIEKAADGSFSAYIPDLPGCTASGETGAEVKEGIKKSASLYIESLREHNEVVPVPTTTSDVVEAA